MEFSLLKKYIFLILTLIFFLSIKNTFAQEPFVLDTEMLETIPPNHLTFLEGLNHDIPFEVLENAEWTEKLINAQSMVDGYWVKFIVRNNLKSNIIGLNHNWNFEKKLYIKNSLGSKEFPYWKHRKHNFWVRGVLEHNIELSCLKTKIQLFMIFSEANPLIAIWQKLTDLIA